MDVTKLYQPMSAAEAERRAVDPRSYNQVALSSVVKYLLVRELLPVTDLVWLVMTVVYWDDAHFCFIRNKIPACCSINRNQPIIHWLSVLWAGCNIANVWLSVVPIETALQTGDWLLTPCNILIDRLEASVNGKYSSTQMNLKRHHLKRLELSQCLNDFDVPRTPETTLYIAP